MALHATRDIDDAIEVTRDFLSPVAVRRWLKLALVVFFVGGGSGFPTSGFNGIPSDTPSPGPIDVPVEPPENLLVIVAAVIVVVAIVWLLFALVGGIMEFVFVESLRAGDVMIRRYAGRWWRKGLRLFGFRIAISLPLLVLVLLMVGLAFMPFLAGIGSPFLPLAAVAIFIPLIFVLGIVVELIQGFTTVFVVPIVMLEGGGILAGWRRLWPSVKAEWKQYLAYAVISFVLTMVAGLVAAILLGIVALILLIPLGLIAFGVSTTLSLTSGAGLAIVGVLVLVFVLAMLVLWSLVQVPIQTYLRYYGLLVLGDIEESFDIVPDRRAAVRDS